jgi:hypothetical protein
MMLTRYINGLAGSGWQTCILLPGARAGRTDLSAKPCHAC